MDNNQDELIRIYARVMGLYSNVGTDSHVPGHVPKQMGEDYDDLVDRASQAMGRNLDEFLVGEKYLSANKEFYVSVGLKAQMEGLVNYLRAYLPTEPVRKIGYSQGL